MRRWTGTHYHSSVPARDLTEDEWERLPDDLKALVEHLYPLKEEPKPPAVKAVHLKDEMQRALEG